MARPYVLIVEDDPDAREIFSLILQSAGADVTAAVDGTTGLESAARRQPDVVLTDLAMPGMDGFEMARRLRAKQATERTPIIALSGQGAESLQRARVAGCDAAISKPCMPAQLIAALLPFVGGGRRRVRRQDPAWIASALDRRTVDRRQSFPRGVC